MKNNYREDGMVWFEDQVSDMADILLNVKGIASVYKKKKGRRWIRKVGDDGLRSALRRMSRTQIRMIEDLVFEGKTITDVQNETGLSVTKICSEVREMRKILIAAM